MADIKTCLAIWNNLVVWEEVNGGESWSITHNGTKNLWDNGIKPRLQFQNKVNHIIEIAPGYGRITQYLKDECSHISLIDLAPICIDACKKRFFNDSKFSYIVNDGVMLSGIANNTVDFVFSWDALVHCEIDVINSYLSEIKRVLIDDGEAFIHCSNAKILGISNHFRSHSVSHQTIISKCAEIGLQVPKIELITWGDDKFSDCFVYLRKSEKTITPEIVESGSVLFTGYPKI